MKSAANQGWGRVRWIVGGMVRWRLGLLFCCLAIFATDATGRADWPEHRGNCQRTGFREQKLTAKKWVPFWKMEGLAPPEPAWPAPARGSLWQRLDHLEPRVTDDRGDVPLIVPDAQGKWHVLVTSSASDRLLALDPITGEMEWSVVTQAPVRYAPSVRGGIAYLGADDGKVRAIDLSDGKELWQTQVGPRMPWVVGNGRLIAAHPIRTSVLVQGDRVFATAGLFPSQGVYSVALDRKTGEVVWRRRIQQSPQGYLLADPKKLFIPTGRTQPFAISKEDGHFLHNLPSPGGSFCMLTPEVFFAGPGNNATIQGKPASPDAKMLSFQGKQVVAGAGSIWTATGTRLSAIGMEGVAKNDLSAKWSIDCQLDQAMIVSGTKEAPVLFVAGGSKIWVVDGISGKKEAILQVDRPDEELVYLAVSPLSDGTEVLVATSRSGTVYCWKGVATRGEGAWPKGKTRERPPTLASASDVHLVSVLKKKMNSPRGLALLLEDTTGGLAEELLKKTELRIVSIVYDEQVARRLQAAFYRRGDYGHRVVVWAQRADEPLAFSPGIFNLAVEKGALVRSGQELFDRLTPGAGWVARQGENSLKQAPPLTGAGVWRHQYANPTNDADSRDQVVGNASAFRLAWFGGVGPSRMPDRHLRGPAPLSVGDVAVIQGDGVLIGIDPANGTERWQLPMPPKTMRYVTPFDGGYVSLTERGDGVVVGAGKELWQVDAYSGKILKKTNARPAGMIWGYVAESSNGIVATLMKPTAPRTALDRQTQYTYVDSDYRSERPLVCSRRLVRLKRGGKKDWDYRPKGVIPNTTIAMDQNRIVFVEARSPASVQHATDRIPMKLLMEDAYLVSVSAKTGDVQWEQPLKWEGAQNMLYVQLADDRIVMTSSRSVDGKANYVIRVVAADDGKPIWEAEHRHTRSGLYHGEQVHHPVILHRPDGSVTLIAEPYFYDLKTGERTVPGGEKKDWSLVRPGHSCGTLTGAGDCLFFRAGNPTVLKISTGEFTALAPNRPGCWINMISAGGRLLIPEASASCVCNYSLQTSMGFEPIGADEVKKAIPILPDKLP